MQLETNYTPCKSLKRPKVQKGHKSYLIKPTRIRTNRTKGYQHSTPQIRRYPDRGIISITGGQRAQRTPPPDLTSLIYTYPDRGYTLTILLYTQIPCTHASRCTTHFGVVCLRHLLPRVALGYRLAYPRLPKCNPIRGSNDITNTRLTKSRSNFTLNTKHYTLNTTDT